jgi:hypothetical protein
MTDILKTAAEVLRLAGEATPGPWDPGEDPDDGEVWDEDKLVVHRIGRHPIAGNARFIAHARTAVPARAAFVQRVDQYTRDLISANRAEANTARDDRAIGVLVGARALREHVGLPEVP